TRGHHHERVGVGDIGPARGQRAQLAPLVVVVDPVLAPVTAAGHELELPTEQRMERVGHPHDPATRLIGCSCRLGPRAWWSGPTATWRPRSCLAGSSPRPATSIS